MRKFIGIPYEEGGRDYTGADCWGLCWLFYRDELQRRLPSFSGQYEVAEQTALSDLIDRSKPLVDVAPTEAPVFGDLVLMKFRALPIHIGIYIDQSHILHILKGIDSVIDSPRSPRLNNRIEGYYHVQ